MSAITTYREAIEQLKIAEEALDQAHAMLRDLNLHNYIDTGRGPYRQTVSSAFDIVNGLLKDLQKARCIECDKPLAENEVCLESKCAEVERLREEARYEAATEKTWEERTGR
jgi:phage FluMu protein Com